MVMGDVTFIFKIPGAYARAAMGLVFRQLLQTLTFSDRGVMDVDIVEASLVVAALCLLLAHYVIAGLGLGGSFARHFGSSHGMFGTLGHYIKVMGVWRGDMPRFGLTAPLVFHY